MVIRQDVEDLLQKFVREMRFVEDGGVVTDLDGTAVHEDQGRVYIPRPVELGLKKLYDFGRPLMINSLRFPLSVIRTFGRDWHNLSNAPIPTISLNGSQIGYVTKNDHGDLEFEEITAFPLLPDEMNRILSGIEELLNGGIKDLLVFYYPRDWRMGEIIWTPVAERVTSVRERYTSASSVTAVEFEKLRDQMLSEEVCMVFLLIDAPESTLMAYQHAQRNSFYTREGVDKLFGVRQLADHLRVNLAHSVGAGDTMMDRFLEGVGLAVHVGPNELPYHGKWQTLKVRDSFELGDLLFRLVDLHREIA